MHKISGVYRAPNHHQSDARAAWQFLSTERTIHGSSATSPAVANRFDTCRSVRFTQTIVDKENRMIFRLNFEERRDMKSAVSILHLLVDETE